MTRPSGKTSATAWVRLSTVTTWGSRSRVARRRAAAMTAVNGSRRLEPRCPRTLTAATVASTERTAIVTIISRRVKPRRQEVISTTGSDAVDGLEERPRNHCDCQTQNDDERRLQ